MKNELIIRIGKDICELNCWRTPPRIKEVFHRNLTEDEVGIVITALEAYAPRKVWIKIWREQDEPSTTDFDRRVSKHIDLGRHLHFCTPPRCSHCASFKAGASWARAETIRECAQDMEDRGHYGAAGEIRALAGEKEAK
jgi:hypothetical protein